MDFRKTNKTIYRYICNNCGNEFEKDYQCEPYRCRVCSELHTFRIEIVEKELIEQLCPICNSFFETSSFLNENIQDEHARWLANMVTHYRHNHISSWNRSWGRNGNQYRSGWGNQLDYDELKIDVNERAKRQILRKCKKYMIENGFKVDHIKMLNHTDDKTFNLYKTILGWNEHEKLIA